MSRAQDDCLFTSEMLTYLLKKHKLIIKNTVFIVYFCEI